MEINHTDYEGWIFGVGQWPYSKIQKLLKRAFPEVEYKYLTETSGAIRIAGISVMFEEDKENLTATFDLLADQMDDEAQGSILARRWGEDGSLQLTLYKFKEKTFEELQLYPN